MRLVAVSDCDAGTAKSARKECKAIDRDKILSFRMAGVLIWVWPATKRAKFKFCF
jgi:hypothetical protein